MLLAIFNLFIKNNNLLFELRYASPQTKPTKRSFHLYHFSLIIIHSTYFSLLLYRLIYHHHHVHSSKPYIFSIKIRDPQRPKGTYGRRNRKKMNLERNLWKIGWELTGLSFSPHKKNTEACFFLKCYCCASDAAAEQSSSVSFWKVWRQLLAKSTAREMRARENPRENPSIWPKTLARVGVQSWVAVFFCTFPPAALLLCHHYKWCAVHWCWYLLGKIDITFYPVCMCSYSVFILRKQHWQTKSIYCWRSPLDAKDISISLFYYLSPYSSSLEDKKTWQARKWNIAVQYTIHNVT